jgi:hypothetical protein
MYSSPRFPSAPPVFRLARSRARLARARPALALGAPSSSARSRGPAPPARRPPARPAPNPTSSARLSIRISTCVLCSPRRRRSDSNPSKKKAL